MPSAKLVVGGAAATAAVGVRVARSLYGRWRMLPERTAAVSRAWPRTSSTGRSSCAERRTPSAADDGLRAANETLAAALVDTAEPIPRWLRTR